MSSLMQGMRPVLTQQEADFGQLLAQVLSPSRPLQSEEYLKGRSEQLKGIRQALYAPGRHIFIHGFRGVGKSSLAQTAAFATAGTVDPVLLSCDRATTLSTVIRDLFEEIVGRDPSVANITTELNLGASAPFVSARATKKVESTSAPVPDSVNEAVRIVDYICKKYCDDLVVVIDEFDQVSDDLEQQKFANFIKQISDTHIKSRFIFCGIGETVDTLMSAHASIDRYFHTVPLERLPYEARMEIVTNSAETLGIDIDTTTTIRIARISDGFPHYVHLISEKLFWCVFEESNSGTVTGELFERAMSDASDAMDMKLKTPYEKATKKYTNEYELILFAAADGHELQRRSADIYDSYLRISEYTNQTPIDRTKFNRRMNSLKQESHGAILLGTRAGWYEYSEKVIRGYARLRAEQKGILLEVDHPFSRKKNRIAKNG